MIENIIVLQLPVAVVVKIHADLLATVNAISPQHRRRARRNPNARQSVRVDLVLLDQALALLVHVNTAVLAVVYLVVSDDGVRIRPDLYARQGVAVDVVVLDQTPALAEYVHTTLVAVVDLVSPYGGIRVRGDPYAGEVVGVDLVVDELTQTVLVDVNAARLAVMYLAMHDRRISAGLHLESRYPVVVYVVGFEVAEAVVKCEYAYVAAMVDVIPPHYRVRVVLHPDAGQRVPRDLVVFVRALSVISHVQAHVLAVRYVAVLHHRVSPHARNAYRRAD